MNNFDKFSKMSLKELRAYNRAMSKQVTSIIFNADEQSRVQFAKEEKRLRSYGKGTRGSLTTGSRLSKEQSIKYAKSLEKAISLEEFTERGSKAKEESLQRSYETFKKSLLHKRQGTWTKKQWEEIGSLFDNIREELTGEDFSETIVDIYKTTSKEYSKTAHRNLKGKKLSEIANEVYQQLQEEQSLGIATFSRERFFEALKDELEEKYGKD